MAENDQLRGVIAVKLVHAQAELAVKTRVCQLRQDYFEFGFRFKPDAVGHDIVESKSQFHRSPARFDDKFGIQERFSAGKTDDFDAIIMGLFEKTSGDGNWKPIGPFDGYAAMGTRQIALIGSGKR